MSICCAYVPAEIYDTVWVQLDRNVCMVILILMLRWNCMLMRKLHAKWTNTDTTTGINAITLQLWRLLVFKRQPIRKEEALSLSSGFWVSCIKIEPISGKTKSSFFWKKIWTLLHWQSHCEMVQVWKLVWNILVKWCIINYKFKCSFDL